MDIWQCKLSCRRTSSTSATPPQQPTYVECPTPSPAVVWALEPPAHMRPADFVGAVHLSEVPQSAFVKRCHGCQGRGRLKCASCYGVGFEVCLSCSGKGTTKALSAGGRLSSGRGGDSYARKAPASSEEVGGAFAPSESSGEAHARREEPGGISGGHASAWVTEACHFCHGAGQKRCWVCAGRSYTSCLGCGGAGQLRCYLQLSVTWLNHRDETILNNNDAIIPRDRLRLASGLLLADEVGVRVAPLTADRVPTLAQEGATSGPQSSATGHQQKQQQQSNESASCELAVRQASQRLLERHKVTYKCERLIKQRQRLTQIQCFVVHFEWKRRRGHFVIYGSDKKVYIAKYPFRSICSIA